MTDGILSVTQLAKKLREIALKFELDSFDNQILDDAADRLEHLDGLVKATLLTPNELDILMAANYDL